MSLSPPFDLINTSVQSLQNCSAWARSHRVEFFNDFKILEDNVGYPIHAPYVLEEHQRFNSIREVLEHSIFFDNQVATFL
jgi:hypothetical protein